MKTSIQNRLRRAKQRIERRLKGPREDQGQPMFAAASVRMELADKVRAIGVGGIGVVHQLALEVGLVDAIDRRLHLLKIHRPYHESDHVLNLAYNALCDGTRLEDIELRRNDEVFLDALGTERIPDPTTAGDFCRRFAEGDIRSLMRGHRRRAAERLGQAAQEVLRPGDDRHGRHVSGHHRRVQRGNGYFL